MILLLAKTLMLILDFVAAGGGCEFPKGWTGRWFQSGVPTLIAINTSAIETKGECVESDGDKFITEDKSVFYITLRQPLYEYITDPSSLVIYCLASSCSYPSIIKSQLYLLQTFLARRHFLKTF